MKPINGITLAAAAEQIGMGPRRLRQALRRDGHLYGKDIPARALAKQGFLYLEIRAHHVPGTDITRQYSVVMVTPNRLIWLADRYGPQANNNAA